MRKRRIKALRKFSSEKRKFYSDNCSLLSRVYAIVRPCYQFVRLVKLKKKKIKDILTKNNLSKKINRKIN